MEKKTALFLFCKESFDNFQRFLLTHENAQIFSLLYVHSVMSIDLKLL